MSIYTFISDRPMHTSDVAGGASVRLIASLVVFQDVSDPAIMVAFPLLEDSDDAAMVAWTTTPWTLISNLALCINKNFTYVKVCLNLPLNYAIVLLSFCFIR